MYKKVAWECGHCGKIFLDKNTCKYHEMTCSKCEYTFSCVDCKNAETKVRGYGLRLKKVAVGCKLGHKIGAKQFVECGDKIID